MKDCIAEGSRPVPAYRESVPDHRPAAAGFHQATISAVERAERIPGIDVLLGICRALAVTPDLYSGGRVPCRPRGMRSADEGFWELWGVWKRLTAGERRMVAEFARFAEWRRG